MPRGSSAPRRYPSRAVIEAVLFDWGNTLVQFTWDDELLVAGHRAGSRPATSPSSPRATARADARRRRPQRPYAEVLPRAGRRATPTRSSTPSTRSGGRPTRCSARRRRSSSRCARAGSRPASSRTPGPSPHGCCARTPRPSGSPALLDVIVFSEEVGVAKPRRRRSSCTRSSSSASSRSTAMFVGDRLETDVQGAANVGMTTVQALWFAADDSTARDRAGLHGVHADGRAERRAARSAVGLKVKSCGRP